MVIIANLLSVYNISKVSLSLFGEGAIAGDLR